MKKLYTFVMAAAIAASGCFQVKAWDPTRAIQGGIKALQAVTLSDSQIREYVSQSVAKMDAESKVAHADSPYTIRLNKLTQGLKDVDGVPLNFKVYITDDVNAFACADGSVRVYSGLMDRMTDDEVLGVIGHEIGHVAHKDTKKEMQHAILTNAVLDGVGSTSTVAAALTDSQLGQLSETLVNAKYSQKQESKADDYGYDFLKASGKNPWAMAMAFEQLGKMEAQDPGPIQKMFSSHPTTKKRIEHLEKRLAKDGFQRPVQTTTQTQTSKTTTTKDTTAKSTTSKKTTTSKKKTSSKKKTRK